MASWSTFVMLSAAVILVFSHIQRIIKRSRWDISCIVQFILIVSRVILSSIRDLGRCPCPRCLIPISHAYRMGMVQDMKQRKTLTCVDDESRRRTVELARDIIYKKNYAVDNDNVEALLQPQSLVPTSVSAVLSGHLNGN
jgi:hypothetical protein